MIKYPDIDQKDLVKINYCLKLRNSKLSNAIMTALCRNSPAANSPAVSCNIHVSVYTVATDAADISSFLFNLVPLHLRLTSLASLSQLPCCSRQGAPQ